jgi:manganese efflux pump family protein
MELLTSIFVAIGLAMDAFAVSLGVGTSGQADDLRSKARLAFHFGWFQAMMTVLGWLLGSSVERYVSTFDHWIAFALLAYVGVSMIRSGLNNAEESYTRNPSKGHTMVMLSVATSIDALAVGMSMGLIGTSVWMPALIIGVVTLGLSAFGLQMGCRLGERFGKRVEVLGGLILIGIGLRVLITHMT